MPIIVTQPDSPIESSPDSLYVDCPAQTIARPRITYREGLPVYPKTPAVVVDQGSVPVVEIVLRDPNGLPFDISCLATDSAIVSSSSGSNTNSSSSNSSASNSSEIVTENRSGVVLKLREALDDTAQCPITSIQAAIVDASAGVVRASLTEEATRQHAALVAEWGIYDPLGRLVRVYKSWLLVERSQFGDASYMTNGGLPSLSSIRVALRDNAPEDNYLLADYEFDQTELIESLVRLIRQFNEAHPRVSRRFNTTNFPSLDQLLNGAIGELYLTSARHYRREHLPYSAAGVAVDDKNKSAEYEKIGQQLIDTFRKWVRAYKTNINVQDFGGTLLSGYSRRGAF